MDRLPRVRAELELCAGENGGFTGGQYQLEHLLTTFAAIHAIAYTEDYSLIDRTKLRQFLLSLKLPNGSFQVHLDGESDLRLSHCLFRALYAALCIAKLCNILDEDLCHDSLAYLKDCFSYEDSDRGGFGGCPFNEPHAGYTYCGLAALCLLKELYPTEVASFDYKSLYLWALNLQEKTLGGFSGRTNKLVDVCYSYWTGSIFQMLQYITEESYPFKTKLHRDYILRASQDPKGGFRDRPGK